MEDNVPWKGVHISQLQTSLNHSQFPKLISNEEHTILFRIPVTLDKVPECFPSIFKKRDFWDNDHVKLPCSKRNVAQGQISQWDLIRNALTSQILSAEQLHAAILNYNSQFADLWNFSTLNSFLNDAMDELETSMFFENLLPKIINLALRLPELITGGIPLLKRGRKHSVSLSQLQISCLLANAFLCTFPQRNDRREEYRDYPIINFNRLFQCDNKNRTGCVFEKLKCLLNYFRRVTSEVPTGVVTFSRQLIPNNLFPDWSKSCKKLPRLYVSSEGTIEDDGFGLFQVDFANKSVGGGVLGAGCVQEEIRFVLCPELIISRLFTEQLADNEAFVITGCERFNKYQGYGNTFKWDGDYVDGTPSDEYCRKYCTVIALDALRFARSPLDQYSGNNFSRDLNKAYAGFSWGSRQKKEDLCGVATGNWGCGAFKGDPKLKSFLQLMAAGEVGRDLAYFTFGDVQLKDELAATHAFLVENEVTIGKLYSLLGLYHSEGIYKEMSVFDFFRNEALVDLETVAKGSDLSKTNVSIRLGRLEITKKGSFCCRTKINDWFRPRSETASSSKNAAEGVDEGSEMGAEKRALEAQKLKNFYQRPGRHDERAAGAETRNDDGFQFLDKFKRSLKRKTSVKEARGGSKGRACGESTREDDAGVSANAGSSTSDEKSRDAEENIDGDRLNTNEDVSESSSSLEWKLRDTGDPEGEEAVVDQFETIDQTNNNVEVAVRSQKNSFAAGSDLFETIDHTNDKKVAENCSKNSCVSDDEFETTNRTNNRSAANKFFRKNCESEMMSRTNVREVADNHYQKNCIVSDDEEFETSRTNAKRSVRKKSFQNSFVFSDDSESESMSRTNDEVEDSKSCYQEKNSGDEFETMSRTNDRRLIFKKSFQNSIVGDDNESATMSHLKDEEDKRCSYKNFFTSSNGESESIPDTNDEIEEKCSEEKNSRVSADEFETTNDKEISKNSLDNSTVIHEASGVDKDSDTNIRRSKNDSVQRSTIEEMKVGSSDQADSKIHKIEKENLNQNRVETLSALAIRQRQSKTPKRTTPGNASNSFSSFSASKKRKISDYFNRKSL